jgi:hypothetical protein
MKKLLALAFKLLATGTITLFIAACYGVMMEWKKITTRSTDGTRIPGLQVTVFDNAVETGLQASTDATGVAMVGGPFSLNGDTAVIKDVDGADNGGTFTSEEITFDSRDEYDVTMTTTE